MKNKVILFSLLLSLFLGGCYWGADIEQDEVGAHFDRNALINCLGPGRYSDSSWWAELKRYSIATHTFEVNDPEVATSDNQLVGVTITIQAARKSDCDSVRSFYSNWSRLLDDSILLDTIDATAREGIKNGTRGFTLNQLLNDRNGLSDAITTQLEQDASKYNVDIINVTIENVALDPAYAAILQQTAQLNAQQDQAQRRQSLIQQEAETEQFRIQQEIIIAEQQLVLEQAETNVQVEIGARAGEVVAAAQRVYSQNPQAFQLAVLERLAEIFNDKTVYFIPEGTDLTTLFGVSGLRVIPQE